MLRPPIKRQGNKYSILKKIIPLIPPHEIYIEPFLGSGSLFFNIPSVEINVLNDLSSNVINMFKLLKRAPLDTEGYKKFKDVEDVKEFYDNHGNDIYDKIIFNLVKNNYGFMGVEVRSSKDIYFAYKNIYFLKHLKDYKEKLNNTILLNEDYKKVIKKYDNNKAFIFLDPPYEKSSKSFYENTNINYDEMSDILKHIKGKFILTVNDSPYMRNVFKDFNIRGHTVRSTGWRNKEGDKLQKRKELIIKNF